MADNDRGARTGTYADDQKQKEDCAGANGNSLQEFEEKLAQAHFRIIELPGKTSEITERLALLGDPATVEVAGFRVRLEVVGFPVSALLGVMRLTHD